jgi:hypothetical protein
LFFLYYTSGRGAGRIHFLSDRKEEQHYAYGWIHGEVFHSRHEKRPTADRGCGPPPQLPATLPFCGNCIRAPANSGAGVNRSGTEFDFPNSTNTTPLGVNKTDQIAGGYVDNGGKMHGFVLSTPLTHAQWQSIDDPNGVGTTTVNGLNDNAQLVGFYVDSAGNTDGFLAS